MKAHLLQIIFCAAFIISCDNSIPTSPPSNADSSSGKTSTLTVNHPEKFEPNFLKSLESSCNVNPIRITDSMMICQTSDTVFFPLFSEYKNLHYTSKAGYSLTLKWINYNALSVDFTYKNKTDNTEHFRQIARLNPCFFLGSESFTLPEDSMQLIFGTQFSFNAPKEYFSVVVDDENWEYCCVTLKNEDTQTEDLIMKKAK